MSQPIDSQMNMRVWERVRGCKEGASAKPPEPPKPPCLQELMQKKAHAAAAYHRLAASFSCHAATFRRFAEEEAHDLCTLQTICFVDTGRCAQTNSPQVPPHRSLCDALRHAIRGELEIIEMLEAQRGPFRPVFAEMAARDRAHADALLDLLSQHVCH